VQTAVTDGLYEPQDRPLVDLLARQRWSALLLGTAALIGMWCFGDRPAIPGLRSYRTVREKQLDRPLIIARGRRGRKGVRGAARATQREKLPSLALRPGRGTHPECPEVDHEGALVIDVNAQHGVREDGLSLVAFVR
jgi:hypothetical protein